MSLGLSPALLGRTRRIALALVLSALGLAPQGRAEAQPPQPAGPPAPVVLIAVDGMEWDVILALLHEGRLPVLTGLMRRGCYGLLDSLAPTQSPVIWTTIATGKPPAEHGIEGFLRPAEPSGTPARLYNNLDRRSKAFWDILSERGLNPAVIGWWITYPIKAREVIATYDTPEWLEERARRAQDFSARDEAERLEQLRSLGYIQP